MNKIYEVSIYGSVFYRTTSKKKAKAAAVKMAEDETPDETDQYFIDNGYDDSKAGYTKHLLEGIEIEKVKLN